MRLTQELGLHELYEEEQYEHNVQTQRQVSRRAIAHRAGHP